jgi:hypothetical protein
MRAGQWQLCERTGWPDNQSHLNLVAWCWTREDTRHLIVVNLSDQPSQARVRIPVPAVHGGTLRMCDELSGMVYERDGGEIREAGLYVDLGPWAYHVLRF